MSTNVFALATLHCTEHVKRGASDAIWIGAVMDGLPYETPVFKTLWGKRGKNLQSSSRQFATVNQAMKRFDEMVAEKLSEGYLTIDWTERFYSIKGTVNGLGVLVPGAIIVRQKSAWVTESAEPKTVVTSPPDAKMSGILAALRRLAPGILAIRRSQSFTTPITTYQVMMNGGDQWQPLNAAIIPGLTFDPFGQPILPPELPAGKAVEAEDTLRGLKFLAGQTIRLPSGETVMPVESANPSWEPLDETILPPQSNLTPQTVLDTITARAIEIERGKQRGTGSLLCSWPGCDRPYTRIWAAGSRCMTHDPTNYPVWQAERLSAALDKRAAEIREETKTGTWTKTVVLEDGRTEPQPAPKRLEPFRPIEERAPIGDFDIDI